MTLPIREAGLVSGWCGLACACAYAWLREHEVQLSALETEDSAAGKAFEFAHALRKAGRLTGKKGKHGRRVVREVALAAELLQRQGVFYY